MSAFIAQRPRSAGNIFDAIRMYDINMANMLLETEVGVAVSTDRGFTPIHIACVMNVWEITENLIAHGADVNLVTSYGSTPLMKVAFNGGIENTKIQ